MSIKVKMYPHPDDCRGKVGGINVVAANYGRHLPSFGIEFVTGNKTSYDLLVGHAGSVATPDVVHNHGLWWTGDMPNTVENHWSGNASVISALRAAKEVTVPSPWVAHNIARGMHISPTVVPHGINWDEWQHSHESEGYVLWNKGRMKDVCDPEPVKVLAQTFPDIGFVSTFCIDPPVNVHVIGRTPYHEMRSIVQRAGVYLATAPETFGIGTLEAMASGVPVLGFNWKGTADIVDHKVTGYLAEPGDYDDLARGLQYVIRNRDRLGSTAREIARSYTWEKACEIVAGVYRKALSPSEPHGVTVVIPSYNYSDSVGRAIRSALNQTFPPKEVIVVDDGSPDQGATRRAVESIARDDSRVRYIRQPNSGVAFARNLGISKANTSYICCLDADDAINPTFLATMVDALDRDPLLGVAYSALMLMFKDGRRNKKSGWPPRCNFDQMLVSRNQVPTCSVFRKQCWKETGGYRQRYAPQGCGTEDAAFWLSIGSLGWKMERVTGEPLFLYTVGGNTWNKKHYVKQDWTAWHPWTRDHVHPFASIATPRDGKPSHPVYQYDIPQVSVVIPVGPGHEYVVTDALDSLEAQTFRYWEGIVVNDSGNEIDLSPWPFLTVVNTPGGKGAGYARNRGTEVARSNLIVYLDADDFLQAGALEQFISEHVVNPGVWLYPDMYIYRGDNTLEIYQCEDWSVPRLWRRGIAPVTCLYTKEMWERVGGFSEESYREDWDFHLRLAKAGICGMRIPEPLFTYRHQTGNRRSDGSKRKEIVKLHGMYNQEELMRNCSGCSKRRRGRSKSTSTQQPPVNWSTKDDLGWPMLEYVGNAKNDIIFKGVSRRKYIAGDNIHHKIIQVHPEDYEGLRRLTWFEPYKGPRAGANVLQAQPSPKKVLSEPPKKTPEVERRDAGGTQPLKIPDGVIEPPPKPDACKDVNIGGMNVKQVYNYDFTDCNIDKLIDDESNGKKRVSVIRYLGRVKRKFEREEKQQSSQ